MIGRASRRNAGFALVEALIAAAILAAMLGAYLASAANAARTEAMIADRREATMIARSALEAASTVGADRQLVADGRDGRFTWRVSITPYAGVAAGRAAATGGPALQRAVVAVYADGNERPLVTLATLRLAL
jgi:type II secretory pathway pseudopilin PulG